MTDLLARPCDACGKPIGGGYKQFPKWNIYLCFMCRFTLRESKTSSQRNARCAMEN
ncbi:hypothetical protein JW988_07785 [Candidatus Bathyarchaeota archaeon]|nr:hypothetical protein [Candidatus Bathyarchaeota archaeon]